MFCGTLSAIAARANWVRGLANSVHVRGDVGLVWGWRVMQHPHGTITSYNKHICGAAEGQQCSIIERAVSAVMSRACASDWR